MDIAIVFEWFAQESAFAAGLTHEQPRARNLDQTGIVVGLAAAQCRNEAGRSEASSQPDG